MKRKALIVLTSVVLLWGLLFALQFTLVGYILIGTCGTEYYRTSSFWREKIEIEGDLPPSFHLQFGGCTSKQGTIVPCLLLYSIDDHINMLVDFSVHRGWTGAQYLDLTRLDLVLQDGRREDHPFKQVSTWTIKRGRGFRKVWLP